MAVVSTLIITAASASAGRLARRTENQQVMLAAQSTAEVLAEAYNSMPAVVLTYNGSDWTGKDIDAPFGSFLKESALAVFKKDGAEKIGSFPITLDGAPDAFAGVSVQAKLVKKAAAIEGDIKPEKESTTVPDGYRKALETVCVITASKDGYSYSTSLVLSADTHGQKPLGDKPRVSVSWYVSDISKGDITA